MKIDGFRELLLKKAADDDHLKTLVKFIDSNVLADKALESLEKMARSRHKGDTANLALRDFATDMDPDLHPSMIRDALGHHVSRYKAALQGGRKDLANMHARQAFNIMNMADRAQKHSQGKLSFEHVSPHAWERHTKTSQYEDDHPKVLEGKYKPGDFKTKTKGLNYKGSDFSFLQGAPHESFKREIRRHGHNQAYPWRELKVNGKYIHVDDVDPSELKGFEKHPFDFHPIMDHYKDSAKNRTPERDAEYFEQKRQFYNESPHIDSFFDRQEKLEQQDPEAYSMRGSNPSDPVHPEVEGLQLEDIEQTPAAQGPIDESRLDELMGPASKKPDAGQALQNLSPEMQSKLKGHVKQPAETVQPAGDIDEGRLNELMGYKPKGGD